MQTTIELRLARHGVIVLLLGLLTGFAIGRFHSRPAGDAAHLTGLIGGFGMIALALLWPRLNLGRLWSGAAAWMTAACMYLNWLGLVLLGAFGSAPKPTNLPLSSLLWDRAGGAMLELAALLSLISTLIILFGLRKLTAPVVAGGAMVTTVSAK
jgi:hydroxylaminobenzene mutase